MADDQQANILSSAFPAPPPFYRHFTRDNLTRLKEVRQTAAAAVASRDSTDIASTEEAPAPADLPTELRCLVPPQPPTTGVYRSFGDRYNINEPLPSLRDQGVEQLFPTPPPSPPLFPSNSNNNNTVLTAPADSSTFDRQTELTKLARSILLSFLELIGILSVNVDQYPSKLEDLRVLFVNAHHLINEYRPHQARETLIGIMEGELVRKRGEIEGVRRMGERVEELLRGLREQNDGGVEDVVIGKGEMVKRGRKNGGQREIWKMLDALEI